MQLKRCTWIVLLVVVLHVTSTAVAQFRSDDYFYLDPDMEYEDEWSPSLGDDDSSANEPPNSNLPFSIFPRSAALEYNDPSFMMEATTECETEAPEGARGGGPERGKAGGPEGSRGGVPEGGKSGGPEGGKSGGPEGGKAGVENATTSAPSTSDGKAATNKNTSQSAGSEQQPVATTCYPLPYPYQHQTTGAPGAPSDSGTTGSPKSQSDGVTTKPPPSDSTTSAPGHADSTTSASGHADSTTLAPGHADSTSAPGASTTAPGGAHAATPPGIATTVAPAHAQSATETTTCIPEDESTPPKLAATSTTPRTTQAVPAPAFGAASSSSAPSGTESTTCIPFPGGPHTASPGYGSVGVQSPAAAYSGDQDGKAKELHQLVQHLYVAQARVQLEAIEIKKAQAVANSAQQQLEEAANHVRTVTAALQTAQQEVASAAIRAQTAQLQLAAHDQLLFAARQDVDALSSQMVGMQAAEGIAAPSVKFDINGLLDKLKQPLTEGEKPTPVPPMVAIPSGSKQVDRDSDYYDYD